MDGLSVNAEVHWQNREDDSTGTDQDLVGVLAQAGYNFGDFELGYQFSTISPDEGDDPREHTIVGTHYLDGHWSKIQLGISFADNAIVEGATSEEDTRIDLIFTQRL